MQYFDVVSKEWKRLTSLAPAPCKEKLHCAETIGSHMFVSTGYIPAVGCCIYSYDIERNVWKKHSHPHSSEEIWQLCTIGDYMYSANSGPCHLPQRYSCVEQEWQRFSKVNMTSASGNYHCYSGATELNSKFYVLYGHKSRTLQQAGWSPHNAVLYCFDPARNVWEERAQTCEPHFRSSLSVVNKRLYVAGGCKQINDRNESCGESACVEVYDEENNKWSVVDQKHIPANNLGAVEVEGKVYFIINNFPVDSGIRIPPGELYPVSLNKWKNLSKISKDAALCYAPLKKESFKTLWVRFIPSVPCTYIS